MKNKINPMHLREVLCCGAKTRSGAPCQSPPVKGKTRCRMHGGTSPGAPLGNQNALKNGAYTRLALAKNREARDLLNILKDLIKKAK